MRVAVLSFLVLAACFQARPSIGKADDLVTTRSGDGSIAISADFALVRPTEITASGGPIAVNRVTFAQRGSVLQARIGFYDRSFNRPVDVALTLLDDDGKPIASRRQVFDPAAPPENDLFRRSALRIPAFRLEFPISGGTQPSSPEDGVTSSIPANLDLTKDIARFILEVKPASAAPPA